MNVPRALANAADRLDGVTKDATVGRWSVPGYGIVRSPLDPVGTTWANQDAEYIATMGPRVGHELARLLRAIGVPEPDSMPHRTSWMEVRYCAAMLADEILGETPELYDWERNHPPESHGDSSRESHGDSPPDAHEDSIVTRMSAADVLEADVRDWQERWAEMTARQTRMNETLERLEMALGIGALAHAAVEWRDPAPMTHESRRTAYTPGGKLVPDAHTGGGLCK